MQSMYQPLKHQPRPIWLICCEKKQLPAPVVSLVAEDNEAVVGHIIFSPVSLSGHAGLKISGVVTAVVRKSK